MCEKEKLRCARKTNSLPLPSHKVKKYDTRSRMKVHALDPAHFPLCFSPFPLTK